MKKTFIYLAAAAFAFSLGSCSHTDKGWSLNGEIYGADFIDCTLVLEGFNNGQWYVIDSLRTTEGEFKYSSEAPLAYPEIMRLRLADESIYFPVDSTDKISIIANADKFSRDYQLDGSVQARTVRALDSLINHSVAERGAAITAADAAFKQDLFLHAFEDNSVMPLYYLVNRKAGDAPLFDLSDPADLRYFGAVAQRFATERPDDPRGEQLKAAYTKARRAINPISYQIEVPETSLIDIVRKDWKGADHSLAEEASKGRVLILSFTAYGLENSPEYNLLLNSLYEKYNARGLDIYQIGFDGDETVWRETAKNLPWTAVWNSTTDGNVILANYNVSAFPTTFLIDRTGTLTARVEDLNSLEAAVQKAL